MLRENTYYNHLNSKHKTFTTNHKGYAYFLVKLDDQCSALSLSTTWINKKLLLYPNIYIWLKSWCVINHNWLIEDTLNSVICLIECASLNYYLTLSWCIKPTLTNGLNYSPGSCFGNWCWQVVVLDILTYFPRDVSLCCGFHNVWGKFDKCSAC